MPDDAAAGTDAMRLAASVVRQKALQLQLQYTLYKAAGVTVQQQQHQHHQHRRRVSRQIGRTSVASGGESLSPSASACLDDLNSYVRRSGASGQLQVVAAVAEWARRHEEATARLRKSSGYSLDSQGPSESITQVQADRRRMMEMYSRYQRDAADLGGSGIGSTVDESRRGSLDQDALQQLVAQHHAQCPPCHPLGEIMFPDLAGGVVRLDAREVHRHLCVVLLGLTGEVEFWNDHMAELTGIPAETAVGQDIAAFMPSLHQQERFRELIARAAGDDGAADEPAETFAFVCSDGVNLTHLELTVTGGSTIDVVAAVGVQANRDGLRGNYLHWVLGHIQSIIGRRQQEGATENDAEDLDALAGLLQQARTVSMNHWGPLHLRTVLNKMIADHNGMSAEFGVSLQSAVVMAGLPAEISTDRFQLPRVVSYLLNNAIRFSQGGRVAVSATRVKGAADAPDTVCITVEDTGPGMPSNVVAALRELDDSVAPGLVHTCAVIRELGGWWKVAESSLQGPPSPTAGHADTPTLPSPRKRRGAAGALLMGVPVRQDDVASDTSPKSSPLSPRRQGTAFSVVLPLLGGGRHKSLSSPREATSGTSGSPFSSPMSNTSRRLSGNAEGPLIKCLLVEPNVVHRMSFCHHLWKRSYALSLALTLAEVEAQIDDVDVVVADADCHSDAIDGTKLLDLLRHTTTQVVLASSVFNALQKRDIKEANWHALTLPIRGDELCTVLDAVDSSVTQQRQKRTQIESLRKAFEKGIKHVPWERGRVLGQGTSGKVMEATVKLTGGKMAVKSIPLGSSEREEAVLQEVQVMASLEHENIIHYFYTERTEDELLIFMEFAQDGALSGKIPRGGMSAQDAAGYMEDILRGLQYLHQKGFVHRDIKVANVLLSRGVAKLTDFGTAVNIGATGGGGVAGTIQYMAPEVLNAGEGSLPEKPSDIWSVGCLLMEICTCKSPFAHIGDNPWTACMKYVCRLQDGDEVDLGPAASVHPAVASFLGQCLQPAPARRPTCDVLLQSPLIATNESMMRKATVVGMAQLARQESHASFRMTRAGRSRLSRIPTTTSLLNTRNTHYSFTGKPLHRTYGSVAGARRQIVPPIAGTTSNPAITVPKINVHDGDSDSGGSDFSGWGTPRAETRDRDRRGAGEPKQFAGDAASPGSDQLRAGAASPSKRPPRAPSGRQQSSRPSDWTITLDTRKQQQADDDAYEQAERKMTLSLRRSFATRRPPEPRKDGPGLSFRSAPFVETVSAPPSLPASASRSA
eukprot:TRINITY_DN15793_c0_g1_i1.p1 TRINITY_DN15793_c0_g1~~TRINITY_DN15793_c0_g1_i1.p1  ORF type:complete len:1277 (+),score=391.77 TRINITY_DN15793_c0_g1_i1:54-3833(+)